MYFTVYKITVVVDLTMWMDAPSLLMFLENFQPDFCKAQNPKISLVEQ